MRYLKNLVPPEHQVLPEYFKVSATAPVGTKASASLWRNLVCVILAFAAACLITRPLIAAVLGLIALINTTTGKRWLERRFIFNFTHKIAIGTSTLLMLLILPLFFQYQQAEAKKSRLGVLLKQKQIRFTADSLTAEHNRRDSLHQYINKLRHQNPEQAFRMLKSVEKFVSGPTELDTLHQLNKSVSRSYARWLLKSGRGKAALVIYYGLLSETPNDPELLYDRGIYFVKTGKLKAAIADLSSAMKSGSESAEQLYNKVNPLRKRVAYYVTRCCDGSTSNATGRGACSWHGGVCNWNDPVYETYRKY